MPLTRIEELDPRMHPIATAAMARFAQPDFASTVDVRITCTLRSFAEQDADYAKGRTVTGEPCSHAGVSRAVGTCDVHPLGLTVTKAPGGMSWHNYGLAFDVAPLMGGKPLWQYKQGGIWDRIGAAGKEVGLSWGGDWRYPDRPHFEWHPGFRVADIGKVKLLWDQGKRPVPLAA